MSAVAGRVPRLAVDSILLGCVAALLLIGLTMVTSASMSIAEREFSQPFHYLYGQLAVCGVGCVAALAVFMVRSELWDRFSLPLLVLGFLLLAAVFIPGLGLSEKGATRWINVGGLSLQASDPARIFILTYLCSYAARRRDELATSLAGVAKPMALLGAAGVLLLLEPDFGATCVLLATGFVILFIAGMQWRYVLMFGGIVTAAVGLLVLEFRSNRITGFLNPWQDPFGESFQLTQSLIAIGRGEWTGVGLGASIQKLFYLPEAHTDFVFAVFAEEFGLVGVAVLLALFLVLVWRVCLISRAAAQEGRMFQAYLAAAFGIWLGVQAMVNIGVNMGVLPTKGLTLPLMSYGRSGLLATFVWLGMVLRIHHENKTGGGVR